MFNVFSVPLKTSKSAPSFTLYKKVCTKLAKTDPFCYLETNVCQVVIAPTKSSSFWLGYLSPIKMQQ